MEKNAHYFVVGVFVSALLTGLVGFLLWLAGTHDTRDYVHYTVYFTDSISGLDEGASVQYKGVEVGKVTGMRLSARQKDLIRVDIEVAQNTPVQAHTTATLGMVGLTGLIYLELKTPPDDTEPPQRREGEQYPVIEGNGTQMSQIMENINKFTMEGLVQIISLSHETQKMAESIRKAADKLYRDPSQILYQQKDYGVEIPQ